MHTPVFTSLCFLFFSFSAQAYTCADLARDNTNSNITKNDLNGFNSIDEKLYVIRDSYLDDFPKSAAKKAYEEFKSEGKLHDPYKASLIIYKSLLQVSYMTNQALDYQFKENGGINKFISSKCTNDDMDVQRIFQGFFLIVQKEMQNNTSPN